ncbi:casein kinase substrate phosphoprotein PP28-domain-containing protein [Fimicolochytrium jonesii]|uniref:casein kinase substrate phosphoprotein PP28-domain-containing protein n=1 Tax=Fimicolochytrium jonesii TaxID=1396493 RepID=UPI0022FE2EB5|nr:casein kinase substrate phosphoprotein PP28-domain-containing protein [Fimicolochytrium jonesii]KAI8817123.1 casein kinase substrate phosphoprotein PP28-domain-containing protein [Fimicolochytrium jonesii]
MGLGGGNKSKGKKPARGGAKQFTPARVLRGQGDVWDQPREEKPEGEVSGSEEESSEEEESSSEDETQQDLPPPAIAFNPKLGNSAPVEAPGDAAARKKKAAAAAARRKAGSDDEDEQIANPNRAAKQHLKASDLGASGGGERELSRREREALEKERAKAAFWKAQAEGKTDQARADMARLAIIRKQREEAAKRKAEEAAAKGKATGSKAESLNAGKGIISKTLGKNKK